MRKPNPAPKLYAPENKRTIYAHSRRDGFNTALTSIITRYKEELKVLESE